ncbi:Uncharacterised protein [Mycobacteroides abscessus]|nr:Uncharacterised protein [Mycobacteroides abscessus]
MYGMSCAHCRLNSVTPVRNASAGVSAAYSWKLSTDSGSVSLDSTPSTDRSTEPPAGTVTSRSRLVPVRSNPGALSPTVTVDHGVSTSPLFDPLVSVRVPVSSSAASAAAVASGEDARTVKVTSLAPGLVKVSADSATLSYVMSFLRSATTPVVPTV